MRHNTGETGYIHIPVLPNEVLEYSNGLTEVGDGIIVDCTVGEGGHSELLLGSFDRIRIIGFERDPEIIEIAKKRLEKYGRMEFVNDNFANIGDHLKKYAGRLSGLLYDFGISSYHFDVSGRGFSFSNDEPLDMRIDGSGETAAFIVNNYSEKELADLIYLYGEERWAKKIARDICAGRREKNIETTGDLEEIVFRSIPKRFHTINIHPATRVFQALRIVVNDELSAIEKSLETAHEFLAPGGRIMAISFHSLEDRIVKNRFRRLAKGCTCGEEPGRCMCGGEPVVRILTKKPVRPGRDEIMQNRRSRSAKLRVCEKL